MSWKFKNIIEELADNKCLKLLTKSQHGLERECLRVTKKGDLSKTKHPAKFGSALKNPYISTDFSESQVELITPHFKNITKTINFLKDLQLFLRKNLKNEIFWPFSMPARLPKKDEDIPLAQYGDSNLGKEKTLYRKGLSYRYGRRMQTISGIHYNFSLSKSFWESFYKKYGKKSDIQSFKNDSYFKLIRNFIRICWIDNYLFGASPVIDKSYIKKRPKFIKKLDKNTYFAPYATTLRMSEIGYCCEVQSMLDISFNSLDSYIEDLSKAISTPYPKYTKIGLEKKGEKLQLNDNIIQIPNEYYAPIRPKQNPKYNEIILQKLKEKGVEYIEIRSPDLDPFSPIGLGEDHVLFLHTLILYCLIKESPKIQKNQQKQLIKNHNKVALYGRKEDLKLIKENKEVGLKDWGNEILSDMEKIAILLDKAFKTKKYTKNIQDQIDKIKNPNLTPSAKILNYLIEKKEEYIDYGIKIALEKNKYFKKLKLSKHKEKKFIQTSEQSIKDQENQEFLDDFYMKGYEDMELSTQILMKEAIKRGVKVEVLDKKDNFIRLSKGKRVEYVKQATKTSKDSYMTFLIMENKQVTKEILKENKINVPEGEIFYTKKAAVDSYKIFKNKKVVVKPVLTNFGIGISFVSKKSKNKYIKAIEEAFKYGKSVIVEEFIPGTEYRFLVINDKMVSIIHRIPANVTGDGIHTVKELVNLKNEDPKNFKVPSEMLKITKIEITKLKEQNLNVHSIPKKGEKIFLRDNSNVSNGGDPIDYTDRISEEYNKIAIKAAKAVDAKICGVDMIIGNIKNPPKNNYSIVELNFNPALKMHNFPLKGKNRKVEKPVLDLLGFY